ncbi:MAG: hypothetical protein WD847_08035 [Pirellulales bacterium]
MAKRRRRLNLSALEKLPPEPLQLPSLDRRLLEGPAYRYTITLPLFAADGKEVFSKADHVGPLISLLALRFGGYTRTSTTPRAPLEGGWLPDAEKPPVVERNIWIQVYSRVEAPGTRNPSDLFFGYVKSVLKEAAYSEQEEILIERAHVELIPSVFPPSQKRPAS